MSKGKCLMQERQMSKAKDVQRLPHELACHRYSGYQALQSPVVLMDDARPESRWGPLSWQNSSNSPRCVKFSYVRHETSEMSNVRHVTFRIEMIQECHKCQIQMFWEWCSPRCVKFSCVRHETSEMSNVRHVTFQIEMSDAKWLMQECHKCQMFWEWC